MKRWFIILALLIYWTFCANVIGCLAQSDSIIIILTSPAHNGGFRSAAGDAVYNTERDKAASSSIGNADEELGQRLAGAVYGVYKIAITPILTAFSSDTMQVDSVILDFFGIADASAVDFYWAAYSFPFFGDLQTTDLDEWDGRQIGGAAHTGIRLTDSITTLNYTAGYGNRLRFTPVGKDSIIEHLGDSLQLIIMSRQDVLAAAPAGEERILVTIIGANEPKLIVYYTVISEGDVLTGSRGTVLREATGKELESHRRKQKHINKAHKKG